MNKELNIIVNSIILDKAVKLIVYKDGKEIDSHIDDNQGKGYSKEQLKNYFKK